MDFILDIQRWGGGEPTAVGEGYSWVYEGKYYSVLFIGPACSGATTSIPAISTPYC